MWGGLHVATMWREWCEWDRRFSLWCDRMRGRSFGQRLLKDLCVCVCVYVFVSVRVSVCV